MSWVAVKLWLALASYYNMQKVFCNAAAGCVAVAELLRVLLGT
jgi:hypothetical protein